tara:strand:+ start:1152 stop:1346 length:195 start_codon:yes stop_codon:yes gene_type:complete
MNYFSIGLQMTTTVVFMALLGHQIDKFLQLNPPYCALSLSTITIVVLLIKLINRFSKKNKEKRH